MLAYIYTLNGISILVNGVATTIAKDDPRYERLTTALTEGPLEDEYDNEFEERVTALAAPPKQQLLDEIDERKLSDVITIVGDTVFYKQYAVDNSLTRRMLDHLKQGVDIKPLVPFLENLMQNPSNRTVEHLYAFLEYGKIPLTGDGHFLAYKAVRQDWYDIHSGTFDNSIGSVCEVPRNQVDENPEQTCSHGLHVCSFEYLPHFAHADGHVVFVKVNPRDVVAIPRDYNNTKMRVCRYEVVGEVDGYYGRRENYLAQRPLFTDWDAYLSDADESGEDLAEATYSVELEDDSDLELPVEVTLYLRDGSVYDRRRFEDWYSGVTEAENNLDEYTPVVCVEGFGKHLLLRHQP